MDTTNPAGTDDDRRTEEEMAGRDAAFWIGVQIGVRLRDTRGGA